MLEEQRQAGWATQTEEVMGLRERMPCLLSNGKIMIVIFTQLKLRKQGEMISKLWVTPILFLNVIIS